jgi:hypothetical protein
MRSRPNILSYGVFLFFRLADSLPITNAGQILFGKIPPQLCMSFRDRKYMKEKLPKCRQTADLCPKAV